MAKVKFETIRRRNQLISFLIFFCLVILMFLSFISNPWYKVPVDWYFIPVLGLVGSILLPVFSGRHYCGQYCPTGFIADSMSVKSKAGAILKSRKLRNLFVLLFVGIFVVSFSTWNMGLPASMTATYWDGVINKLWILWIVCPFTIALPLVVVIGLAKGGRTWCNYLCPWGAIGASLSSEQLEINDNCTTCQACTEVCPQPEILASVIGSTGAIDKNCLFCLRCIDVCPNEAIDLKKKLKVATKNKANIEKIIS